MLMFLLPCLLPTSLHQSPAYAFCKSGDLESLAMAKWLLLVQTCNSTFLAAGLSTYASMTTLQSRKPGMCNLICWPFCLCQ